MVTLAEARQVVDAALERAREHGFAVAAAVVDAGGFVQALGRMDGATPLSSQAAEAKAYGAMMLMRDGEQVALLAERLPRVFDALNGMARLPLVPAGGAVPIRRDGRVIGAVGISGAPEQVDADCAAAALAALETSR